MAPPKKAVALTATPSTSNTSTRSTRAAGDTSAAQDKQTPAEQQESTSKGKSLVQEAPEEQQSPARAGTSRESSAERQITLEMIWQKIQHFEERLSQTPTSSTPPKKKKWQKQQRAESRSSRSDDDATPRSTSNNPRRFTSQAIRTTIEETPAPERRGFRPVFTQENPTNLYQEAAPRASRTRNLPNFHYGGAPKPKDPDPLDDGLDPTFASWSKLLHGELIQHGYWYPTEAERMAFVFRITKGKARGHLETLYLSDHPMAFQTAEEMVEHLADCFEELDQQADARDRYAQLRQGASETFRDFRIRFLDLATRAGVDRATQLDDIFRRANPDLQEKLLAQRRDWTSLQQAIRALDGVDKELASFRCRTQHRTTLFRPPTLSEKTSKTTSAPAPLPARESTPPWRRSAAPIGTSTPRPSPTPKLEGTCYNCGKPGHMIRDCPDPKRERSIYEIAAEERDDEHEQLDEDACLDEESGKEDA